MSSHFSNTSTTSLGSEVIPPLPWAVCSNALPPFQWRYSSWCPTWTSPSTNKAVSSCPVAGCLAEETDPHLAIPSFQAVLESEEVLSESSFLEAKHQLPQLLHLWLTLETLQSACTGYTVSAVMPCPWTTRAKQVNLKYVWSQLGHSSRADWPLTANNPTNFLSKLISRTKVFPQRYNSHLG